MKKHNGYGYVDQDSSDVAKLSMLLYVIVSLILCGGSVFGFTPLKHLLLDEGVYKDVCLSDQQSLPCEAQLVQLDGMFTLAGSLFSVWQVPAGLLLRFLGPRLCMCGGFAFIWAACLVFAMAPPEMYTLAYVLIGTGNPLIYIPAFNFGKLYPRSSNLVFSIFVGCFGFSSVVFFVFHEIHFRYGLSSRTIFMGFSAIPMALALIGMVILPLDPYHVQYQKKLNATANKGLPDELTPLRSDSTRSISTEGDVEVAEADMVKDYVPLKNRSISQQLLSAPFLAQAIFFCWGLLHQNVYLATLSEQVHLMANHDPKLEALGMEIAQKFALFYPLGSLLAVIPVGILVRQTSVSTSLFVYCAVYVIFSGLSLVPYVQVQWVTSAMYVVVRVGFFTVMSTYSAATFGFQNLTVIFGCAGSLAGLCSLLGVLLSNRALNVDHSFVVVNTILFAGACVSMTFPAMVRLYWER